VVSVPHVIDRIARRAAPGALYRRWRRVSLRTKILLGYIALISAPLLIVAVGAYQTSTVTIEGNAQRFSAQLTDEIRANLDTYARQSERLTYWPFQAADVRRVLRAYQARPGAPRRTPGYYDVAVMDAALSYLGHARSDIAGIYVVTTNGTLFHWTASGDLRPHPPTTDAAWYRAALAADGQAVYLPTQGQSMIAVATGQVFSLARALYDARGTRLGSVRVDLDAAALANVVQRVSLGSQGRLLVETPAGEIVYPISPNPATLQLARAIVARRGRAPTGALRFDAGGQALLATYNRVGASGWDVVGVVPTAQLLAGANHLGAFILTVATLCILAGALTATIIVGRLTRPLRQLRGAMRRVEARDLDTRIAVGSEDEVGQLAQGFNTMLDELRRLVDDVLRAQIHEREAELKALQNQINPHFLYNTLESINMLALTHGDREISRMVTSLGRLLRLTMSSSDPLIPLQGELDYVHHYLVVQRTRYGDRIGMTVDVDASLLACPIPKLTLQPLVENALYHGLEPQRGAGHVTVRGWREGEDLVLSVEDDGVGMDAGTLSTVEANLREETRGEGRSIGLANVEQRLKLHCGPAYGLTIASVPGRGTQVRVRMPWSTLVPKPEPELESEPASSVAWRITDAEASEGITVAHYGERDRGIPAGRQAL